MNDKAAREGGSDGLMRSHRLNAVVRLQTQVDVRETPKDGNGSDESIIHPNNKAARKGGSEVAGRANKETPVGHRAARAGQCVRVAPDNIKRL